MIMIARYDEWAPQACARDCGLLGALLKFFEELGDSVGLDASEGSAQLVEARGVMYTVRGCGQAMSSPARATHSPTRAYRCCSTLSHRATAATRCAATFRSLHHWRTCVARQWQCSVADGVRECVASQDCSTASAVLSEAAELLLCLFDVDGASLADLPFVVEALIRLQVGAGSRCTRVRCGNNECVRMHVCAQASAPSAAIAARAAQCHQRWLAAGRAFTGVAMKK